MKTWSRTALHLFAGLMAAAVTVAASACGAGAPATTTTAAPAGPTALTVTSGAQTKTYTMSQIKAMKPLSGYAGQKNKAGTTTGPVAYKGVALTDILAAVGGFPSGSSVKVTATDGFSRSFTYAQVSEGSFTVYDKTGAEASADTKPLVFLAYERDGAELDSATGPLQMGIMTGQNRVADNSLWVKMAVTVEVVAGP